MNWIKIISKQIAEKKTHANLGKPQQFVLKPSGASHSLTYERRSVNYFSLFKKKIKSRSFKRNWKKNESLEPPSLTAPRSLIFFPLRPQERWVTGDCGIYNLYPTISLTSWREKKINDNLKRSSLVRLKWKGEHSFYISRH